MKLKALNIPVEEVSMSPAPATPSTVTFDPPEASPLKEKSPDPDERIPGCRISSWVKSRRDCGNSEICCRVSQSLSVGEASCSGAASAVTVTCSEFAPISSATGNRICWPASRRMAFFRKLLNAGADASSRVAETRA